MHLQTTYLIRCVSQPLGAIVKGWTLADEVVEHLEWKTNFISWREKESTSVPEMWKFRPNPSYYEGQILSLVFINTDKSRQRNFPVNRPPYLVIIFHSSVCPSVSPAILHVIREQPYQECSGKCFQIIAQGLDLWVRTSCLQLLSIFDTV